MKCIRKETLEYCPVEYTLDISPGRRHPGWRAVPDWFHEACRNGVIVIDHPYTTLLLQLDTPGRTGYEGLRDGYLIRDGNGRISAVSDEEFKRAYEIIDLV